jgi:predicted RNA binding protein YcfA (HicA-like mRNA interferase family)
MKRTLFIKHLNTNKCYLKREGSKHSLFRNIENGKTTTVPRHPDIDDITAERICVQLEIPKLKKH